MKEEHHISKISGLPVWEILAGSKHTGSSQSNLRLTACAKAACSGLGVFKHHQKELYNNKPNSGDFQRVDKWVRLLPGPLHSLVRAS